MTFASVCLLTVIVAMIAAAGAVFGLALYLRVTLRTLEGLARRQANRWVVPDKIHHPGRARRERNDSLSPAPSLEFNVTREE